MQCRIVIVTDKTQHGYLYVLSAPSGFDPESRPGLTPKQMLRPGVFCGKCLTDCALACHGIETGYVIAEANPYSHSIILNVGNALF